MTEKQTQDQILTFRMTPDEVARLDRIAAKYGISRSRYIRNVVHMSVDEDESFEKFGIIRAAITVRDILGWMNDKMKKVSEDDKKGSIEA